MHLQVTMLMLKVMMLMMKLSMMTAKDDPTASTGKLPQRVCSRKEQNSNSLLKTVSK
jgi:hypothetical protein